MNESQHVPAGELPAGASGGSHAWADARPLLRRFVSAGDLAFDIGAHVGDRTLTLRELGCRVVCVEPQEREYALLVDRVGTSEWCTPIRAAVGAENGVAPLYVCDEAPYLTTLEPSYPQRIQAHAQSPAGFRFRGDWTTVVTLDDLIDEHGVPAFCKIDVEGGELGVLEGLSRPLDAISFEVHDFDPGKADACIGRLDALGDYRYHYSPRETFRLESWPPARLEMFGDVYAELRRR